MHILVWKIEEQLYAIDLTAVDSVLLATEVTRLPNAPDFIIGAINVHGHVTPVVNMRKLLGIPEKSIEIQDHFILSRIRHNQVAIWVDNVRGIKSCSENELIPTHQVLQDLDGVEQVLKEDGKIILLYDLEKLIPLNTTTVV